MTVNDERSDCNLTCSICLKHLKTSCLQNGKSETIEKDERRGWMMIFWLYKMAWEILQVVFYNFDFVWKIILWERKSRGEGLCHFVGSNYPDPLPSPS